jgi:RNA polymerase sigma-70 factor (ECF subfamily)
MMAATAADLVPQSQGASADGATPGGALVERLVSGEQRALAELYDAHAPRLRRFARTLVGETAAAEDLVHEVFVALPRALRRFRGDGELSSFVLSIAANKARNHVRHAMRTRAALARAGAEPAAPGVSPEHSLQNAQLRLALSRALDRVPLKQRLAFVLCGVEGMSAEDAAVVLSVPAATIRSRLHRARAVLRAELAERCP